MRCPVPYALVALLGWGFFDWVRGSTRTLASSLRGGLKTSLRRSARRTVAAREGVPVRVETVRA